MNKIFALDIGTRKVAGIIAMKEYGKLRIIDCEVAEHETRAMLDGQIHDIEKVAALVSEIRSRLEQRSGEPLKQVAVAVAGRALKTRQARVTRDISPLEPITRENIINLELAALREVGLCQDFHRVGHHVSSYELDGERIANLAGQRGSRMEIEIIATFLPHSVLASMYATLEAAGLEPVFITLEPIAAVNAIIPPDMRRLDLLLADIGAGTSDLALTHNGSVIAFGMVPVAGDEVTEKLCAEYLLDFPTGEKVKRALSNGGAIQATDIFGRPQEIKTEEAIGCIAGTVEDLAKKISAEVLQLCPILPQAVVCVGGGSLTPLLKEKLAESFTLAPDRIGIRGPEKIPFLEDQTGKINGPEFITPLGIALMALEAGESRLIAVTVNGQKVQLMNINNNLTVLDALIASGIGLRKIYGKIGQALTYEYNGEVKVVKGIPGTPAIISVNGQQAEFTQPLNEHDEITFTAAVDGVDGQARIGELVERPASGKPLTVTVNGEQYIFAGKAGKILMNGQEVAPDDLIVDRARIEVRPGQDARAILLDIFKQKQIDLQGVKRFGILVNGEKSGFMAPLADGAEIKLILEV